MLSYNGPSCTCVVFLVVPRSVVNGLNCFQVYVTGADGEQMVLSGPEAAALLAQAGISLGEQEQV